MLSGARIILRMGCTVLGNTNLLNWLRSLLPISLMVAFDFVEYCGTLNI